MNLLRKYYIKSHIAEERLKQLLLSVTEHILLKYPDPEALPNIENNTSDKPLLGLSHGISGFVLALSQANHFLKDSKIKDWIEKALHYESQFYDDKHKNWPDFRLNPDNSAKKEATYMMAWCHGAPGIGLSRLAVNEYAEISEFEGDIQKATDAVFNAPIYLPLNLCHGSLGNVEVLIKASQSNYISKTQYQNYVSDLLQHAQNNTDKLELKGKLPLPGLMTGHAGIAYQMMRIAHPDQIPSILC